jgi:phosphonate transport system permease protein
MKTLCSKINTLLNTWFPKKQYQLSDGTLVTKPRNYTPLVIITIAIIFIFFWIQIVSEFFQTFGVYFFISKIPNFFTILEAMFVEVNFSYLPRVLDPMMVTIQISILGTALGTVLSLPIAFLASQNLMKNSFIPVIIKFILSIIRTFPTLVYALILSFIFGYGTFIGLLATIIFTFGIMSKMMYEVIETIDLGPFVAVETSGATKIQAFMVSIIPQVMGRFYSIILYNFEINLRASAVLGFVGAGGIGLILNDQMSTRNYGNVSVIVLALLIVVIIVESISRYVRGKLS